MPPALLPGLESLIMAARLPKPEKPKPPKAGKAAEKPQPAALAPDEKPGAFAERHGLKGNGADPGPGKQTKRTGIVKNEKPAPLAELATAGDAFVDKPDPNKVKKLVAELNAIDNKSAEAGGLKSAVMKRAEEADGLHRGALAKAARYFRMDPSKRDPELAALGLYLHALGIIADPTLFDGMPPDTIPAPKTPKVTALDL